MKELTKKLQEKFNQMSQSGKLFRVDVKGDDVWGLYIKSFSKENNPIFRDPLSSEHNCNLCNNFIRRYGNIVSIDENFEIQTMFDIELEQKDEYFDSMNSMQAKIKGSKIVDVFFETFNSLKSLAYESCEKSNSRFLLGVPSNTKRYTKEEADRYGVVKPNELRVFNHFHLYIDNQFVDKSGDSIESIMGKYKSDYDVFKRAMETISLDTLELVRDLINQGSLLDGTTHLYKVEQMIPLKKEYDELKKKQRDNWCWIKSYKFPLAKFRNELIGVLCKELSEGVELNKACQDWNKRVDPVNYMKTTAPITKKQIEEAKKFVEENGYIESFDRRFATLDDINISEILHSNVGNGRLKTASIFDNVKPTSTSKKKQYFDNVEEVSIEKFMEDILPNCTSVEAFLMNKHLGNMVTLTTSSSKSKPIFKWNNPFSWTFNGNLAGKSQIKEAVKTAGGKIDGVLRFSIMWSGGDNDDSDLDAHCEEPTGHIYYANRSVSSCGNLDIDIRYPLLQMPSGAVENITYPTLSRMKNGVYEFYVHQFSARNSRGFKAEIEFNGETYSYEYNMPVKGNVEVARVTLKNGEFTIEHHLPEMGITSKDIYGLETNNFHKVNLVCLSPNHWGNNNVGNKHYFFMLEGCKSPVSIRSFHNENLLPELANHRRTLEILATTNMIEPSDKQLSGLGFNSTIKDELIVKLQGSFSRVVKIKF